ncbi:MAG: glutaredoxin 3 [Alphaproteobacteria bacterium]|nr:MAG: glutaredoxin 3 [Alphaproteobacteria bacterium]
MIEIYTTTYCPHCTRAKDLLKKKGQSFTEINCEEDENVWNECVKRSGGRQTVPQIFINGTHVGGADDLYALDKAGKLDGMLGL